MSARAIARRRRRTDKAYTMRHMGCKALFDFRAMDANMVKNLYDPKLEMGTEVAMVNGDIETFSGGKATGFYYPSVVGTYSQQTFLPWDSDGVSAQKITGATSTMSAYMNQMMTTLTVGKTYKFSFKIAVKTGVWRMRMIDYSPFLHLGWMDFDSNDEAKEYHFFFNNHHSANISFQLFLVAGVGEVIIDDLRIEEVANDIHPVMHPANYDAGAWDGREYDFSGGGFSYSPCFDPDNFYTMFDDARMTTFFKGIPDSPGNCLLSKWRASTNDRIFELRLDSTPDAEIVTSQDGSAQNIYTAGASGVFSGSPVTVTHDHNDLGSEEIRLNGEALTGAYTTNTHQNDLKDSSAGVPFMLGAIINSTGGYTQRYGGTMRLQAIFDDLLSNAQKEYIESLLTNHLA